MYVIMGGIALMASQAMGAMGQYVAIAGLAMMGAATLFSFITLPVENIKVLKMHLNGQQEPIWLPQ